MRRFASSSAIVEMGFGQTTSNEDVSAVITRPPPPLQKSLSFFDDVDLPAKDKYRTNRPLETIL